MGNKFVGLKRHLPTGEIVVGLGLVILSVGVLPLWAAIVGMAFVAMGIGGLRWTNAPVVGSGSGSGRGGRVWGVLLILMITVWLAWPAQDWDREGVDVTRPLSAAREGRSEPKARVPAKANSRRVPASPPETVTPAPYSIPTDDAPLAVFSAKHKHRIRDCEGLLTFSVNAVRFDTAHSDDSFVYAIDQVELDDDGVRDLSGKAWHFSVDGRDLEDTFKRWKAGALPMERASRSQEAR